MGYFPEASVGLEMSVWGVLSIRYYFDTSSVYGLIFITHIFKNI